MLGDLQAAIDALSGPGLRRRLLLGRDGGLAGRLPLRGPGGRLLLLRPAHPRLIGETPRCPTILHFGKTRRPSRRTSSKRSATPIRTCRSIVYDAGHGFASDRRADYSPDCARLARLRTLQIFSRSSGVRSEI